MKIQIIPSLLRHTKIEFIKRLRIVSRHCQVAQLDVLDRSFVPYVSFHDPQYINSLKPKVAFEVHLMIRQVSKSLPHWNYPWVKKIIFHYEAERRVSEIIKKIKFMKKKTGLAVNPETPAARIYPFLKFLNTVLVMTVRPGRNAAPFAPSTVKKIKQLRNKEKKINIAVDGGVNPQTAKLCVQAGANLLVVGSYLDDRLFPQRLSDLWEAIKN